MDIVSKEDRNKVAPGAYDNSHKEFGKDTKSVSYCLKISLDNIVLN